MNVFLFLGTHLPEIRTVVSTLVETAGAESPAEIIWPEGLAPPEKPAVTFYQPATVDWTFDHANPVNIFILLDPRDGLLDQLEQIASSLRKAGMEPAQVICTVDCHSAETDPRLRKWLEAAIFFSDSVLLGNRHKASKPFLRDFEKAFTRRCYPCRFMLLKGPGRPARPQELLLPDSRRLSHLFDLPGESDPLLDSLPIEASCDLDADENEADEDVSAMDPVAREALEHVPDIHHTLIP
jgi:hypothetical protein